MDKTSFASMLFFTRAAVRRDPALASARLGGPFADWGAIPVNHHTDPEKDGPALMLGGLLRAWDDPEVLRICPDCLSPMLFIDGRGGGMLHWHFDITWFCPFCERTDRCGISGLAEGEAILNPIRAVFRRLRGETAEAPEGLPFPEALARIRALRDADLLDPLHPLEAASVAQNPLALHAIQDHPPKWFQANRRRRRLELAVRDARIRAELLTPERLASARTLLAGVLERQKEACAAAESELANLRSRPGESGPKTRLWRGEITNDDYSAIVARKRELAASLRPDRLAADRAAAIVVPLEQELGRALTADERRVFVTSVEELL